MTCHCIAKIRGDKVIRVSVVIPTILWICYELYGVNQK